METLPFVAQANTGMKRSVRKVRIMDVGLDCVVRDDGSDGESASQNVEASYLDAVRMQVAMWDWGELDYENGDRVTSEPSRDRPRLARLEWDGSPGWLDRVALRFITRRPLQIAGLSYRAIG